MNPPQVMSSIREVAMLLHRGNVAQAEPILHEIVGCLGIVMQSGASSEDADVQRAQQTLFAIEEVRTLMTQGDFGGAAAAARDAAREWQLQPAAGPARR